MARALRINVRGGWYHVTTRGTERKEIFKDDPDYLHYLDLMRELVERFLVRVHAYVLMPNHTHLIIETPEANLSDAMQWLNGSYSMWFNRRENRVGPLFQGRFKAVLFEGATESWPVTRYVHLNQVRVVGMEQGKGQRKAESLGLRDVSPEILKRRRQTLKVFRWSSYQFYAGWKPAPEWVVAKDVLTGGVDGRLKAQREAYREYVESVMGQSLPESPLKRAMSDLLLGSEMWVERMRKLLKGDRKEQKAFRELEKRPDWRKVRKAMEQVKGEDWERFSTRYGDWGRDLALYIARRKCGLTLRTLANEVGLSNYYAVAQAITRISKRLENDRAMQKMLESVTKCINIQT